MQYSALPTQQGYAAYSLSAFDYHDPSMTTSNDCSYSVGSLNMKASHQSLRSVESADFPYDRALKTRNTCIAALIFCWIAGLAVLGFGIYILWIIHTGAAERNYWQLPHMVAEGIPLAINLCVTLIVETTGYIHTASLRWSLQREGKLTFNSNLRLLSFSRTSAPNAWYSNFIVLACITLAYASSSLAFWHSNKATDIGALFALEVDYVTVGGLSFFFLGLCILGLAGMSTWALCATKIPSWSSSPLDTAYAAMHAGNIRRHPFRCMMSVHDARKPPAPTYPSARQKGAWRAHWEVRWVLILLWVLVILCFAWAGIIKHLIPFFSPETPGFGSWSLVPDVHTSQLSFAPAISNKFANALAIIALYAALQGPLTFGLHCAELQVNLSRDEAFWRKATRPRTGCRLEDYDSVKAAFTSWQSLTLAGFKTVLHWCFGLSVQVLNGRVYFGAVQIVYLALLSSILASYVTYISARRPKAPQPAAFGHLQTLVNLVDEWSAVLYWGHKSDGYPASPACHAGTAASALPSVKEAPYCG
ncbi:hypothetical protein LTR36_010101 [Oleoguttula mirabilis]|uniref:Uncharacterized protein n=1 Tax=Oleoguttula mirabilis TaxID=1507867 RepID=A0AAV9JS58_9PEZI|nr:hypothetical protein LTR36_010101 [Oleoguttula mirabilis]